MTDIGKPWKVIPRDETPGHREPAMVDTGDGLWTPIGRVVRAEMAEQQAAYIVHAANSYPLLVEALREARTFVVCRRAEARGRDQNRYEYANSVVAQIEDAFEHIREQDFRAPPLPEPAAAPLNEEVKP